MAHLYASYWDRGAANVPDMTGARTLLDAHDLVEVCGALGIDLPLKVVLDVGCGTGRLAQIADGYHGCDITQSAVDYCTARGLSAERFDDPSDIEGYFGWVTCISVFTHIDRDERLDYLRWFADVADDVLVDIIPGDGSGAVELWTADDPSFRLDALKCGFKIVATTDKQWDDHVHRYFHLRRVQ
jgi:SAM-dependent methyltransferase